jgi:hypothetical protein
VSADRKPHHAFANRKQPGNGRQGMQEQKPEAMRQNPRRKDHNDER